MKYGEIADYLTEVLAEPITLTIRGKEWTFPGSIDDLPLAHALRVQAWQRGVEEQIEAAKRGDTPDLTFADQSTQIDLARTVLADQWDALQNELTAREFEHLTSTLFLHWLYGSEIAATAWAGTLDKATDGLGETSGQTGKSSTLTAPTGSTPTLTSKPDSQAAARPRGKQSRKRGRS